MKVKVEIIHTWLKGTYNTNFQIGSEVEVLQDLIMQGSLQHLDTVMIEYHTWMTKSLDRKRASSLLQEIMSKIAELNDIMKNEGDKVHSIKVLSLDDESYYLSNETLPECSLIDSEFQHSSDPSQFRWSFQD